ncbi:MAG: hypothetical protein IKO71_06595 [Bacteroidaceae bacterium]|nr:hypothetical protein [Bacteroidaceae bacterium]
MAGDRSRNLSLVFVKISDKASFFSQPRLDCVSSKVLHTTGNFYQSVENQRFTVRTESSNPFVGKEERVETGNTTC